MKTEQTTQPVTQQTATMAEAADGRFLIESEEDAATDSKPYSLRNLTVIIQRDVCGCHRRNRPFFICILLLVVILLASIIYGIYYFAMIANTLPDGIHTTTTIANTLPVCHSMECLRSAAALKQNMDLRVDPCDDFYSYACGNWADDHPRPEHYVTNTWYLERQLKIFRKIRMQLERNVSRTDPMPVAQAKIMYQACLNSDAREKEGFKAIAEYLQEFGLPKLPTLLMRFGPRQYKFDWISTVAKIQRKLGLNVLIGFDIVIDQEDQNRNLLTLKYHSLPKILEFPDYEWSKLRSKSYKSSSAESYDQLLAEEADVFLKIAQAIYPGFDETMYKTNIKTVAEKYFKFLILMRIALKSALDEEQVAKQPLYCTVQELQSLTDTYIAPDKPYPIWQRYLDELFAPFPEAKPTTKDKLQMTEENIDFLKKLVKVVSKQPLEVVELYIWLQVTMYIKDHKYNKMYNEESCAKNVQSLLGLAVSYEIADKNFLDNTKPRVERMLNDIREEFNQMVLETTWMDEYTQNAALEKSKSMKNLIGFPEWILDVKKLEEHYRGLQIKENRHLENWVSAFEFLMKNRLQTWRVKNEKYWNVDPATVNAFNILNRNAIYIPVAIIQYPFYFLGLEALNYGALGETLGHELTHGFDDSGRNYDKFGNEKRWWSNQSLQEYDKRASCLVQQYSEYYLAEGRGYVDGNRTLGENIADNGGLREAFRAYRAYVKRNGPEPMLPGFDEFSHEQLFFISFGHKFCRVTTRAMAEINLKDVHSPGTKRVKGVLSNMPEFSEAFKCASGREMNPEHKCRVW